jgi:hypothetical protein
MLENYLYNHKGFYRAGNKTFINKLEACLELNKIGGDHYPHWNYHEDVFSRALWTHEPPVDIEELYRQRALQLREQYDHLVLFFSGGSDSTTILQAFIRNNIKIDEIIVLGAFKAEEKIIDSLGWSREPGYYTREVKYITFPILKELQKTHKFKITVWDWSEEIVDIIENDPDWWCDIGTRFAPDMVPRKKMHDRFRHNDLELRGKHVAFIYGIDKPRLFRDDTSVYFAFIDIMITIGSAGGNADIHKRDWENDEFFYWSPNFPLIPIKQAHLIYNHYKKHNLLHTLVHVDNKAAFQNLDYYKIINPIVYPSWDTNTWQIIKPSSSVKDEFAKWFWDVGPESAQKKWQEGINEVERQLGGRWFNDGTIMNGMVGSYSKFYRIGPIS